MTRLAYLLPPLSLLACTAKNETAPAPVSAVAKVASAARAHAAVTAARPRVRPAECLCDEQGLPMLAQITRTGVTVADGKELPLFAPFYYVFAREPEQGDATRYTLGTTRWRPGSALRR